MKKITKTLLIVTLITALNVACKKKEEDPKPFSEVKSITPMAGMPGDLITLQGSALGVSPEATKIAFNDVEASIVSISDDSIVVNIPNNAIKGQNQLTVKVNGEIIQGGNIPFTITFPPKISSLSVTKGRIGTYVTLTVEDLGTTDLNALTVKFGDVQAPKLSLNANKIDVIAPVPVVSSDKVKITVAVANLKSKGMDFEYEASPTAPEELTDIPQTGTNKRPTSLFFNNGNMYAFSADNPTTFIYESFLLKSNSAAWEKVNDGYYISHAVVVGDYAFLSSKFQILKLNIKTGEISIHVGADNPKIAPNVYSSIAADKAGNLYLFGSTTKEILKISSTGSVDVLPGFDLGANHPRYAAVINEYLFITYNNGNVYKYNLTTQGPLTLLCNSAFGLINGLVAYKGQIYISAGTSGLKRIDPETGVITDVQKSVDARINFYIDQDTGIMYYINRTNFKAYRYYLN